jgi:putative SOS response-associated peptidase YedK
MCGRMTLAAEEEVVAARFHVDITGKLEKRYNAYPNHDKYQLPVITEEAPDKILMFYWGLLPPTTEAHLKGSTMLAAPPLRAQTR